MRPIPLKSARLTTLLSNITNEFFKPEAVKIISKAQPKLDELQPGVDSCSDEYLEAALKMPVREYGYPRACLGHGMDNTGFHNWEIFDTARRQVKRVGNFLGTPVVALTMIYPDNGYIGWHHNGNAPGYNILMSYSQDGDGYFSWYDRHTKQINKIQDTPGKWTVKVGYYPNERSETERVYWHCAATKKQRISVAFILNHRDMWLSMINAISEGDYDKEYVQGQGDTGYLSTHGMQQYL